jgi:nucleotide-binding universal stress UspA family protein
MIVIGAARKERAPRSAAVFGSTVEHVLKKAPCRVMVIGAARQSARLVRRAAA